MKDNKQPNGKKGKGGKKGNMPNGKKPIKYEHDPSGTLIGAPSLSEGLNPDTSKILARVQAEREERELVEASKNRKVRRAEREGRKNSLNNTTFGSVMFPTVRELRRGRDFTVEVPTLVDGDGLFHQTPVLKFYKDHKSRKMDMKRPNVKIKDIFCVVANTETKSEKEHRIENKQGEFRPKYRSFIIFKMRVPKQVSGLGIPTGVYEPIDSGIPTGIYEPTGYGKPTGVYEPIGLGIPAGVKEPESIIVVGSSLSPRDIMRFFKGLNLDVCRQFVKVRGNTPASYINAVRYAVTATGSQVIAKESRPELARPYVAGYSLSLLSYRFYNAMLVIIPPTRFLRVEAEVNAVKARNKETMAINHKKANTYVETGGVGHNSVVTLYTRAQTANGNIVVVSTSRFRLGKWVSEECSTYTVIKFRGIFAKRPDLIHWLNTVTLEAKEARESS